MRPSAAPDSMAIAAHPCQDALHFSHTHAPMNPFVIDAWTFDVGVAADSVAGYVEACARRVEQGWDSGADLVLFPEYTWAGLEPHLPPGAGLAGVARTFWDSILLGLRQRLSRPGRAVVLGTAPFLEAGTGRLLNRAPVILGGDLITQDKLFLTPWERAFRRGEELRIFEFQGLRIAVLICLDIEVPELSALLRGRSLDLILVPSATETLMGCERVTRCASARAVELGCAVVVAPLTGRCASELVDENLGKTACYLPSQAAFAGGGRLLESAVHHDGFHTTRFSLAQHLLTSARAATSETNPSLIDLGPMPKPTGASS